MDNSYSTQLRAHGFRMTPQRWLILRLLKDSNRHLTPIEIFHAAQAEMPGMTEATVYRTLNFLTQQGMVLAAHVGNGQLVYEIAAREHHHLICRQCGQTHEIDHSSLQALYQQFQDSTGYQIDSLHLTFFGLCPDCLKTKTSRSE